MKKFIRKNTMLLIGATVLLVTLGTLLLKGGIHYYSKASMEKLENLQADETTIEFISDEYRHKDDTFIEDPKPIDKVKQADLYNSIINSLERAQGKAINSEKEENERRYQAVKDKVNVRKEDVKEIFKKKIYDAFGDILDISDIPDEQVLFIDTEYERYDWYLFLRNEKSQKSYCGNINGISGEVTLLSRHDYKGLENPDIAGYVTWIKFELKNNKIDLYLNKTKEIINKNNIANSQNNSIKSIAIKNTFYAGLRPFVDLEAKMQDKRKVRIAFYADTDELLNIQVLSQY
ncbi:hypothetical protein [Clostridium cellulovorans]|uniref:Uncharacterized protein n=1 Tax=Clostridium cellulovorans (strain ATCC 35296 / DSM 3052 / OCM 3 / 743B) TaxID=573061 RepID=D9SQF7_CLOC7|nr:hypothetical protein [Clostridium cellulovorans]ADL50224.1 hypothetical protein Clocel_0448 [Clostridium cellulovorans 743B]